MVVINRGMSPYCHGNITVFRVSFSVTLPVACMPHQEYTLPWCQGNRSPCTLIGCHGNPLTEASSSGSIYHMLSSLFSSKEKNQCFSPTHMAGYTSRKIRQMIRYTFIRLKEKKSPRKQSSTKFHSSFRLADLLGAKLLCLVLTFPPLKTFGWCFWSWVRFLCPDQCRYNTLQNVGNSSNVLDHGMTPSVHIVSAAVSNSRIAGFGAHHIHSVCFLIVHLSVKHVLAPRVLLTLLFLAMMGQFYKHWFDPGICTDLLLAVGTLW